MFVATPANVAAPAAFRRNLRRLLLMTIIRPPVTLLRWVSRIQAINDCYENDTATIANRRIGAGTKTRHQ
jgi:hypothetical protein